MTTAVHSLDVAPIEGLVPREAESLVVRMLLRPEFCPDHESILLAGFDRTHRLIALHAISSASVRRCYLPPPCWRSLFSCPTLHHVLIAHNHPSNIARPSQNDIEFTRETSEMLRTVGVDLIDHLIVTTDGHFSFVRAGLL